ncbi:MAG: metallophosphatase family protein [Chlorobi bacterium]|nr:metallophosphatase family protein [Chlorobiota bacterium]MCI0714767.1 metallophosphatase family protein [Chlorobiota bacterium]
MIYAVISDIHANLEALEVCLSELEKIKPERLICLGDLVDYCAQPNEVVELIKNRCDVVILGNHDEAQFNHQLAEGFSESAYISSVNTRNVINPNHLDYFKTLSYTHSENDLLFVHGSPYLPEEYDYVLNTREAGLNFNSFSEKVCFIGHSHRPVIYEKNDDKITICEQGSINPEFKYIINVGSVGQPRDSNPKLAFGLFDTDKFEFHLIRLDYNIEAASQKIIREGLPASLAQRLFLGI